MKLIGVIDTQDYEFNSDVIDRGAVRCVSISRGKILLLKTNKNYYVFPGGHYDLSDNNDDIKCLERETVEETGYFINNKTVKEMGLIIVIEKDKVNSSIINTRNYYYFADLVRGKKASHFHKDYEIELGYEPVFISIKEAYNQNLCLLDEINETFLSRDTFALKYLIDNPKYYRNNKK
ncbi:NUDIX domain-containing protein [bacterium]|nr:NUDIX domain-containing protein [bacterium]